MSDSLGEARSASGGARICREPPVPCIPAHGASPDSAGRQNPIPKAASRRARDAALMGAGLLIILICPVVDAMLSVRTSDPEYLAEAASRLDNIPAVIGNWESVEGTVDERERRMAEIVGAVRREYRHRFSGYRVTLTVLSGRAGPMTVHPPTACFQGVGYALRSEPVVATVQDSSGATSELNRAVFARSESRFTEIVRVFWGWSSAGQWESPANPRLTLRGRPGLYKLYVVDRSARESEDLRQAELFMEDCLPAIREALTPSSDRQVPPEVPSTATMTPPTRSSHHVSPQARSMCGLAGTHVPLPGRRRSDQAVLCPGRSLHIVWSSLPV